MLYTETFLREKAYRINRELNRTTDFALKEFAKFDSSKLYDIFLSHSIKDKEVIQGLAQELKDAGFTVYLDWIEDPLLDRSNVTKATAALLQARMKASSSLIFAYSDNSPSSKWMPWELGYFNGLKDKVTVVQIVLTENLGKQFPGQEYLELYPYIDHAPSTTDSKDLIWVNDRVGKSVSYQKWLKTGIIA